MAINHSAPITKNDYPTIAMILVEAVFFGDKRTAKRWEITTRTIRNYRQLLEENADLSACFLGKRREFESDWSKSIPGAMIAGIDFLTEAAKEANYKNPETINAVSNAVKTLAEVGLAKELIDARLGKFDRQDREEVVPVGYLSSGSEE